MTEASFKTRFGNHKLLLNNKNYSSSTALSKHVWDLKNENKQYSTEWSVIKHAKAYESGSKFCPLCLAEKMEILNAPKDSTLNKRSELLPKCRYENKFYACNFKCP